MFEIKLTNYSFDSSQNRMRAGRHSFKTSVWLVIYLFLAVSSQTQAQVLFDNATSNGAFSATGLTTLSVSHTVGSVGNRALYVGVSTSTTTAPAGAPNQRVADVTFNLDSTPGTLISLTRVGTQISTDFKNTIDLYRLTAPPTGTGTVTVNFVVLAVAGVPNLLVNYAVAGVTSYSGVSQTTPNGAFVSAAQTGSMPTVNVSDEVNGDLVLDVLGVSPTAGFVLEGALQTRRYANFLQFFNSFDIGAGSTEPGSSSSTVSMSWTLGSNSDNWALGAVAIKQSISTAANVTISGRITSASGKSIARARVNLTDSKGETRTASTNFFGYYRFADVSAGETYVMNVISKQHSFNTRIVAVNQDTAELNFTAQ